MSNARPILGRRCVDPTASGQSRREIEHSSAFCGSRHGCILSSEMIVIGEYLLDDARMELYRDGTRIEMQRLPLELLRHLIKHRDRTVERSELLSAVWPDTHVSDGALSSAVYALRRALRDHDREKGWLRTVRGRGFRFEGPCRVVGASPEMRADPIPCVQREPELGRLDALLERAAASSGSIVLIEGAAGMGKSRLVTEFGRRNADARIAVARADPDPGLSPGAPLHDVLVQLNRRSKQPESTAAHGHPLDRQREEIEADLLAAVEEGPATIILEDLHWADPLTLATLSHLSREIPSQPILLIATFRPNEAGRAAAHLLRLALQPGVERIRLGAFSVEAVFWVLSRVRGGVPTPDEVADVLKRSEGIPLYVAELAQVPASEAGSGGGLPVDRLLQERIATLSAGTRAAIGVAGVCGGRFDLGPLQAVGGEQMPQGLDWLEEATSAGVLCRDERDPLRYHFSHALLRDAAVQEMPAPERAAIHGRIAVRLEALHPNPPDHVVDAIARHWGAALPYVGDVDRVMDWELRSARLAARRREWPRVADLTERLRRWIEGLPRGDPRRGAALELELLAASSSFLARTLDESRDALERAAALYEAGAASDDDATLLFGLQGTYGVFAADSEWTERAVARLAELEGPTASEVGRPLALLADLRRGRFAATAERGAELADADAADVDRLPLPYSPVGLALANAALAAWAVGRDRQATELLAIAERRAVARGEALDQAMALFSACVVHELRGDWRTLRTVASRLDPLCHEHDLTRFHGAGFSFEQWAREQLEGSNAAFHLVGRVVRDRNDRNEANAFRSYMLGLAGRMLAHGGCPEEGLEYLVEAEQVVRAGGEEQFRAEVLRQQAAIRASLGQREAAIGLAKEAHGLAAEQSAPILELRALVTWLLADHHSSRSAKARLSRLSRLSRDLAGVLQPAELETIQRLCRGARR